MARTSGTHHGVVVLGGVLIFVALLMLAVGMPGHALAIVLGGVGLAVIGYGVDTRLSWRPAIAMATTAIVGLAVVVVLLPFGATLGDAVVVIAIGVAGNGLHAKLLQWRDRQLVDEVERVHADPAALERVVERTLRVSRPIVFDVANVLASWGRYDLVERIAMLSVVPECDSARQLYLAVALHARGNPKKALEIARTSDHAQHGPFVAEQWNQLVARIQISLGDAASVITRLSAPCPVNHALTAANRQLVLADAHVALGNVDAATAIVQSVARLQGRGVLLQLKEQLRPSSSIAAALLDGATPYR